MMLSSCRRHSEVVYQMITHLKGSVDYVEAIQEQEQVLRNSTGQIREFASDGIFFFLTNWVLF